MMAAFNVTALADFGYNETTRYMDPMEDRWRAKKMEDGDYENRTGPFSEESIRAMVEEYTTANPYSDVNEVEKALDDYWRVAQSSIAEKREGNSEASSQSSDTMGQLPRYQRMVV